MKKILSFTTLVITCLFSSQEGYAQKNDDRDSVLSRNGDHVLLTGVNDNSFTIFLSYSGKYYNKCGIRIISRSGEMDLSKLFVRLSFKTAYSDNETDRNSRLNNNAIEVMVSYPDRKLFGEAFKIVTKSGKTIGEEIADLSGSSEAEVVAEILPCK